MAILIGWKQEYCIDDGEIDAQHKRLVQLANRVLAVTDAVGEATELRQTVKELFQYIEYHFAAEEQFMLAVGYPGLEEQKQLHSQLVHDMNQLLKTSRDYVQLLARLKPVMTRWVLKHIREEDSKIGVFLKAKKVSRT